MQAELRARARVLDQLLREVSTESAVSHYVLLGYCLMIQSMIMLKLVLPLLGADVATGCAPRVQRRSLVGRAALPHPIFA
jgi:hypothetical protein